MGADRMASTQSLARARFQDLSISILVTGYDTYIDNHALQLPIVDRLADASMYPGDPFVDTAPYYASVLWRLVAMVSPMVPSLTQLAVLFVFERPLPADLPSRTHFFWTSGTELRAALARWPELRERWHASGPGRTWQALQEEVGRTAKAGVWLDYDDWLEAVCPR